MSSRYPIVVQGEASETDSDDEVYITSLPAAQTATAGTKVPGEAAETDSEAEQDAADRLSVMSQESTQILKRDLPPLIVLRDHPDIHSIVEDRPSPTHKPHGAAAGAKRPGLLSPQNLPPALLGETLLQQKLQESNCRLYADVSQMLQHAYGSASREVRGATAQLTASQSGIINASHSIRIILDDLKAVSEKIDIITSCQILPDIQFNSAENHCAPVQ
ncbi:biogenesis of lysosome-related organelles complex 1 subunit 3 isoform X1 [Synchiropus splendidus]|uniref:biogenesis of lysosome-related organelles complex 1 subunit 3 isoform X1 n=1 Tax=Synchiropus splendidus TaxID=270530 RepID=UPI00237ED37F|nr:biogenesis of lysosome-related organelles complex 1 subunit 3 isoform X1 [Synchiropus splendidus]XP_053729227.1 biogenesis of lysosome-related organelles complex 1 subunit 3 isoform X1 [Synchiropus splendidus]XP_053729228.1 biogenesis of lysosome-related organelles complex 1 subunit 3 isoform X1 [Synchiropus splendidus]